MSVSEYDSERRIAQLETKVETALAIDTRLKKIESDLKDLKPKSGVREWLQTLGPYVTGLLVLYVGYVLKDSVTIAMQREQLDLSYVTQMRDLVKDFDKAAASDDEAAYANAVGLAMFGKYAIMPLVERLGGASTASVAAQRGLLLIGSDDPHNACRKFIAVIDDSTRRFAWDVHKSIIQVIGRAGCTEAIPALERYQAAVKGIDQDPARFSAFAERFSDSSSFDIGNAKRLAAETGIALTILKRQKPA